MSRTVDTRTVEMRFDNKNFESNVKQSMSTLDKLKEKLKLDGASKGLEEVEKKSKKLEFKDLDRSIDNVGKKFSALETIATGVFLKIGMSAAEAGAKILKSFTIDQVSAGWNKYAQMTSATQTIMANLRDETGKWIDETSKMEFVNRQLDKLMTFSDETSYRFINMTQNVGKFVSSGLELEEVVTAMEGIAGLAGLAGKTPEQAEIVFDTFSKAITRGYVSARDFYNIQTVMTAEAKEQAIAIGEELGLIEKGSVTISNFRDSFIGKGGKSWFNKDVMMQLLTKYGAGADYVLAKVEELGVASTTVLKDLEEAAKAGDKEAQEFVNSIGYRAFKADQEAKTFQEAMDATADAVSSRWAQIFKTIFGDYLEARKLWTDLSEDLYTIFVEPLNGLNEIISIWNTGFKQGPKTSLDIMFEEKKFDDLNNTYGYISESAAEAAAAATKAGDDIYYEIEALEDGSKRIRKYVKNNVGGYDMYVAKIYQADKDFLSGRTLLFEGLRNIMESFFLGWEEEVDGVTQEHLSVLGAIKRAFLEVFFPDLAAAEDGGKKSIAERLFELTKKFKEFTEKLKLLGDKLKNIFKGFFTALNIVRKFIMAVIKPFKDLFSNLFEGAPKGVLGFADSVSTWVQEFDKFLEENKVFEKVSNGIKIGLDKISEGLNWLSQTLTGLSLRELTSAIKNKITEFFKNYDFKGHFEKIGNFFSNIVNQIKQVETENLPDKLTPLQNFWIGFKKIFEGIKKFFGLISVPFKKIGEFIASFFTGLTDSIASKETEKKTSKLQPIWEGIKKVFSGIVDFFEKIGPALEKIGSWLGEKLSTIGDAIGEFARDHDAKEIIEFILKGGFIASLTDFFFSISKVFGGTGGILKSIQKDLDAVRGVLKAYQREINASTILEVAMAIGILAGSLWVLAQIPSDKLKSAGAALAIIAGAVAGFSALKDVFKILTQLSDKTNMGKNITREGPIAGIKNILTNVVYSSVFANDATAKFVKICLGILLAAGAIFLVVKAMTKVADAFKALADIPPEVIEKGGKVMAQVMVAFGAFAMLAGTANRASSALFAALGALILVFAIKKLVNVLAELGSDSEKMNNVRKAVDNFKDVFKAVAKIAQIVVLIGAGIAVIQAVIVGFASLGRQSSIGTSQVLKQFGKNFARIALSFVLIAGAMAILAGISKNMSPDDWSRVSTFIWLFTGIMGVIQTVAIGLASFGKRSGQYTADLMKQFGKNFIRIAASMLIIAAAFAVFKLINLDLGTLIVVSAMFAALGVIITRLTKFAGDLATQQKHLYFLENLKGIGKLFLAVAAALVIVAGAFWIMSKLGVDPVMMGAVTLIFTGFAILAGAVLSLAKELSSIKKSEYFTKNLHAIAAMFLSMAGALLLISGAFWIMSKLNMTSGEMWRVFGIFALLIGIIGGIGIAILAVGRKFTGNSLAKTLLGLSVYVGVLAASMLAIAGAFAIMDSLKMDGPSMWRVFGIFALLITIIGGVALAVGTLVKRNDLVKTLLGLSVYVGALATSMVIMAAAFAIMDSLDMTSGEMWRVFGIFALLIGIIGGIALLAGVVSKNITSIWGIASIGGVVVLAAGSIWLMALAIAQIADSVPLEKMDGVFKLLIVMGSIIAVMGLIGIAAGGIGVGALGLVGLAIAIIALGGACWLAAKGLAAIIEVLSNHGDKAAKNLVELSAAFKQALKDFGSSFGNIMLVVLSLVLLGPAATIAAVGLLALAIPVALIALLIIGLINSISNFTEAFAYFVDVVGEKGSEFANNISLVLNALLDAIIETGPKIYDATYTLVTSFVSGLFAGIVANAETISGAITTIIAIISSSIVNNAYLISNAVATLIIMTIMGIIDALADNIDPMIKSFTEFIDELASAIENNADSMINAGKHLGKALLAGLFGGLGSASVDWSDPKAVLKYLFDPRSADWSSGPFAYGNSSGKSKEVVKSYKEAFSFASSMGQTNEDAPSEQGAKDGESYKSAFLQKMSGIWGTDSSKGSLSEQFTSWVGGLGDSLSSGLTNLTSGLNFGSIFGVKKEKSALDIAYEQGKLDDLNNTYGAISRSAAEAAASTTKAGDDIYYEIKKAEDGSEYLYRYIKNTLGGYDIYHAVIYDSSSGFESLLNNPTEYINNLLNGDVSGGLSLSPIIDGSSLSSLWGQINDAINEQPYTITVTPELASSASFSVNGSQSEAGQTTNTYTSNDTYNNTFNITNPDTEEVTKDVTSNIERMFNRKLAAFGLLNK